MSSSPFFFLPNSPFSPIPLSNLLLPFSALDPFRAFAPLLVRVSVPFLVSLLSSGLPLGWERAGHGCCLPHSNCMCCCCSVAGFMWLVARLGCGRGAGAADGWVSLRAPGGRLVRGRARPCALRASPVWPWPVPVVLSGETRGDPGGDRSVPVPSSGLRRPRAGHEWPVDKSGASRWSRTRLGSAGGRPPGPI